MSNTCVGEQKLPFAPTQLLVPLDPPLMLNKMMTYTYYIHIFFDTL